MGLFRDKYPNKRLRLRGGSGRFRKATLDDVGMTVCPNCQSIVPIKYDEENGFVDPRSKRPDCDCTPAPEHKESNE